MIETIWQDVRYAARSLRRTPGFTTAGLLTLALGIGANTAIFSVVNGVLLRPLPYGEPERLVHVYHANPERGVRLGQFSPQDFDDLRADRTLFERTASYFFVAEQSSVNLTGIGEPVRLSAAYVSADLFPTLQTPAALGRTLEARENVPGFDRVVVLSDGVWRRRFGADPALVGRTVTLNGEPHFVAGVMPRTFQFPAKGAELWLPISQIGEDGIPHRRSLRWLGAAGLALAMFGMDAIVRVAANWIPRPNEVQVDAAVIAFTLAVSLVTGLSVGLLPAFRAARSNVQTALRDVGQGLTPSPRHRFSRATLVVAETAMAVVLVVGAGLMLRTVWQLVQVDPGFRSENVLTLHVPISTTKYQGPARITQYREEMIRRIQALPGVVAVGASKTVPLIGGGEPYTFSLPGQSGATVEPQSGTFMVTPGYFRALGIQVLAGRSFDERDGPGRGPVLMVNESMARRYWPDESPVGKRLLLGDAPFEVIGLVANVRTDGLAAGTAEAVYVPHIYFPRGTVNLFIRTSAEPLSMVRTVVGAIRGLEPEQPIADISTMEQVVSRTIDQPRFLAWLLGAFAAVAILLASIGLYGVISYVVGQRRQEIGVRMALGAQRADVMRMVLRDGMTLAALGVTIGLAIALTSTRILQGQLYGVTTTDAVTFTTVPVVLMISALLASCVPTLRAARVDPMTALRSE